MAEAKPRAMNAQLTPRGAKTRASLVDAARIIFERDGFLGARITDIAETAGVAHGTFYTYFKDKESVFAAVAESLRREFLDRDRDAPHQPNELPYDRIMRANRVYYETYVANAKLMGLLEQVATFNDEFRTARREVRHEIIQRSERAIRRWQAEGIAKTTVDPHYAANALGSMVDRSMYIWLVLEEPHEREIAIESLTRLWADALGVPTPTSTPRPRTRQRRGERAVS